MIAQARLRMLAACFLLGMSALVTVPVRSSAASAVPNTWRVFVVSAGHGSLGGQLTSFDGRDGFILKTVQLPDATDSPSMLLSPNGSRLYLAAAVRSRSGRATEGVEMLDAATLKTLATAVVPHRVRYIDQEYGRMALSPDRARLFVYAYSWQHPASDWLTVLDAKSLRREGRRVNLPGCGAERMDTAGRYVLVLCEGSSTLYLVSPQDAGIAGRVQLSAAVEPVSNLVISGNGKVAYVADANLQIFAIKLARHPFVRVASSPRLNGRPIGIPSLAATSSPHYLLAGTSLAQPGIAGAINVYLLPSLTMLESFNLFSSYRSFAGAPSGFYTRPLSPSGAGSQPAYVDRWQFGPRDLRELDRQVHVPISGSIYAFTTMS